MISLEYKRKTVLFIKKIDLKRYGLTDEDIEKSFNKRFNYSNKPLFEKKQDGYDISFNGSVDDDYLKIVLNDIEQFLNEILLDKMK